MVQESECGSCDEEMKEVITIKGKPVIDIYGSCDGRHWFVTEKLQKDEEQFLFGYVRFSPLLDWVEFCYLPETELKKLGKRVWKVPKDNWDLCPELEVKEIAEEQSDGDSNGRGDVSLGSSNQQYSDTFQGGGESEI